MIHSRILDDHLLVCISHIYLVNLYSVDSKQDDSNLKSSCRPRHPLPDKLMLVHLHDIKRQCCSEVKSSLLYPWLIATQTSPLPLMIICILRQETPVCTSGAFLRSYRLADICESNIASSNNEEFSKQHGPKITASQAWYMGADNHHQGA